MKPRKRGRAVPDRAGNVRRSAARRNEAPLLAVRVFVERSARAGRKVTLRDMLPVADRAASPKLGLCLTTTASLAEAFQRRFGVTPAVLWRSTRAADGGSASGAQRGHQRSSRHQGSS